MHTIATQTHKLHWQVSTWAHMQTLAALPHACTCLCRCTMGTNFCLNKLWHMYYASNEVWITHPSRWLPKQRCRNAERMMCMGHLALTGSTGAPIVELFRTSPRHNMRPNEHFTFHPCMRVCTSYPIRHSASLATKSGLAGGRVWYI